MALGSRLEAFQESTFCAVSCMKVPYTRTNPPAESHQHGACRASNATVTCTEANRVAIVFDMETEDPDDVLTLLFLAAHVAVDLKAVTVTPGSQFQVSLIRWLLQEVGLSGVRVGATDWPKNKNAPAPRGKFYTHFGHMATKDKDCEVASKVLLECCDKNTTLLTGGPLTNLAAALTHDSFQLGRWVAQGGFAGEGVVPWDMQMNKFKGMHYCRTTNFGSDPHSAHCALRSKSIDRRVCVSKNVCHQTLYADGVDGWHTAVQAAMHGTHGRPVRRRALELMYSAMSNYLSRQDGKMIHDPLALAVALDESVCSLAEVELYSHGPKDEQWGCWLCPGSGTWISVDYDEARFRTTLLHDGFVKNEVLPKVENELAKKDETVDVTVVRLSCIEKEVLKLAKKIREITKLEEQIVAGFTLQSNQQAKIDIKEDITAQFLELFERLPAASEVKAKVYELMPATRVGAAKLDEATAEDVLATKQAPDPQSSVEVDAGAEVGSAKLESQSAQAGRRWRQCGGRSGFKR